MIYEFSPKQDLHGYNKPWAPGAGMNLLNLKTAAPTTYNGVTTETKENNHVTISGISTGNGDCYILPEDLIDIESGESYTLCWYGKSVHVREANVYLGKKDGDYAYIGGTAGSSKSATSESDYQLDRILLRFYSDPSNIDIDAYFMFISGTTVPASYTPYSNICPPEGYNIWDPNNAEMVPVYSGYVDAEARKLYLHPWYTEYDGEELVGPWMSSMDEYTEEGTPTTGAFVVDMGGELIEVDITDFMLQTLLDSLGVRRFITSGAMLLNSLMDQAQGRVRSEEELLNRSLPIHVIAIGDELPTNLIIKKSDILPGLPGKIKI